MQAVDDQHDRGRDHRAERAAGADRADGELLVVAEAQHLRQGDQAEQHDLAADDAGHRRHDDGHQRRLHRHPAGQPAGEHPHGVVEVVRHPGSLEHAGHEDEERHGDQHVLVDEAVDPAGDERQAGGAEPEQGAADGQRHGRPGERHTEQHEAQHDGDDQDGGGLDAQSRAPSGWRKGNQEPRPARRWRTSCSASCSRTRMPAIVMIGLISAGVGEL